MKAKKRSKLKSINAHKSYGKALSDTKIYFEGKKPKGLSKDGKIKFGKNILEKLKRRFGGDFRWIITYDEDSIQKKVHYYYVRTSERLLGKMGNELISSTRDIKNEIIDHVFPKIFPDFFQDIVETRPYLPGSLSKFLHAEIISKLSTQDKEAVTKFIPEFIAAESVTSINLLKAEAQIESLKELAEAMNGAIVSGKSEGWWQTFIKSNILVIQQGYIQVLDKMNVAVGQTKFPDFSLISHDNYLDILEIKKPDTNLLKYDSSRDNYYWDIEISKAIIQTENYIKNIEKHADNIRSHIKDKFNIDLQVLRPRGVVLAGSHDQFENQKAKDDFRLLSQGAKNISFVTYSELHSRLLNYIQVLESFRKKSDDK